MSSAVFGGPGGTSLAINDLGQMARTNLENFQVQRGQALLPGELSMQPIQMQHQAALGRLATAEAGVQEQNLRESQAMAAAMQGMSQGGQAGQAGPGGVPPDPLQVLPSMINAGFQAGAVRRSMDLLKDYQVLVGHRNAAEAQAARARWQDSQTLKNSYDWVGRNMPNVQSQDDLDRLSQEYSALYPQYAQKLGQPSPWAGKVYSPELVKSYADYGMTQSQKLAEQARIDAAATRERIANQNADLRYAQILAKAEADKQKQADAEARAKAGGKNLGQPSKDLVAEAARLIKRENPDAKISSDDLMSFATSIASDATATMQNNRAVRPDQALYRAYGEKKGDLETTPGTSGVLGFGATPPVTKYKPKQFAPGTQNNPIPAVSGVKPEEGKYYIRNGQLGVVKNGQVELVQ